ncbi:MAG: HAD-IC family P-type ATPase, partial [Eubacteriaceae bacterium]|nr:HAD-IC family P-type ATPase [Eubacteriaceae bacterium]
MSEYIDPDTSKKITVLKGLKAGDVLELRAKHGENRLPKEKEISPWKIILNQLKSPLVYIILAAAGVSLALGETGDFLIIIFVVVVDVILGFIQEYRAQRTYTALKNLLKPTATVIRDLQRVEVEVWEIVPGDLVVFNAGEKVPGDGVLLEAIKLSCDESILTGESEPLLKRALHPGEENQLKEHPQESSVSMGTTIVTGRGILKITRTGLNTELGQIAESMSGQEEEETPFQIRLKAFSKILTYVVVTATLAILGIGVFMGREFFEMLRTSIILAIAAVPEGLLIAVTVILVLGMRKILKRNGLVKKLLAVETLGSVTVICTDKTGTLTEGRMRVSASDMINTEKAWQIMVLCNNLEGPVDIALWEYAEEQVPGSPQVVCDSSVRLGEELFTSEKKYMITAVTGSVFQGESYYFLKGAPEIIMAMCEISSAEQERIMKLVDDWADQGLRLLGLAYRKDGLLDHYGGYRWAGLVGMEDPVREGVVEAILVAKKAGIQIKMITGDYRRTAERIASIIGLVQEENQTLEGKEIAAMTDLQLQEKVKQTVVFSRIHPQD